jgi:orotate phosphoribosyltransferase
VSTESRPHAVDADPRGAEPAPDADAAERDQLLALIKARAIVHERVILSSGRAADYYVDLRRITLDAAAAPLIGPAMLELTKDLEYDAVGGLTLGADPVAMSMLHAAAQEGRKLDAFVVRKAEKTHGLQRRIEGPDVKGRRVLAVEDTSTTGGSVLTAVEALREAGAEVVAVAVIVDRATGAKEKVESDGLEYRSVFGLEDLGLG